MTTSVYAYCQESGVYLGQTEAYESPLESGVYLIQASATEEPPPDAPAGYLAVRRNADGSIPLSHSEGTWLLDLDWRGVALWQTNGQSYVLGSEVAGKFFVGLGDLPDWLTDTARPGDYYIWQEGQWTLDEEAQRVGITAEVQAQLASDRAVADSAIAPLQDAIDLGLATERETTLLMAWKQYRVLLNRVPQQAGYPLQVDWPAVPA